MSQTPEQIIGGRYRLDRKLGEGGLGVVFQGWDLQTDLPVAIKMLKPEISRTKPVWLERFHREAEALRLLDHPNIVKVWDTIEEGEYHFIVMEYVAGGSLRDVLDRENRMDIKEAVQMALDLTDALTRTHRVNIVHRDVKPDNVLLLEDMTPLLTDFGAAHISDASALTMKGTFIGTMSYLAPEIIRGEDPDPRSDIWAFGIMLYEMLTGFRPFMGVNVRDLMVAIIKQPVPDLVKLRPDCPPQLAATINGMLEKERDKRTFSTRQVGAQLEQILYS